jgi:hypothetical protein
LTDNPFTRAERKIEELPNASDRAFDCLAGGVLRLFTRVNELERAYGDLARRVRSLEAPNPAAAVSQPADLRRTARDGRPDTGGSSAASRFAHRKTRQAAVANGHARQVAG